MHDSGAAAATSFGQGPPFEAHDTMHLFEVHLNALHMTKPTPSAAHAAVRMLMVESFDAHRHGFIQGTLPPLTRLVTSRETGDVEPSAQTRDRNLFTRREKGGSHPF